MCQSSLKRVSKFVGWVVPGRMDLECLQLVQLVSRTDPLHKAGAATDAGPPEDSRHAGHISWPPTVGRHHRAGLRDRGGGLCGQALLAHSTGGPGIGGPAAVDLAGLNGTLGTLRAGRSHHRLRPGTGDCGGRASATYGN